MDHNHLTIKTFMATMAERDAAIQERNLALDERKRAFTKHDMAMLQRDAASAEHNSAIKQRDDAISTLRFQTPNSNFTNQEFHHMFELTPEPTYQVQSQFESEIPKTKGVKSPMVGRRRGVSVKFKQEALKQVNFRSDEEMHHMFEIPVSEHQYPKIKGGKLPKGGKRRGESVKLKQEEWKDELLNNVNFDETTMSVPVCSCTGVPHPCYRWGSGGWQSACCTTTMSMYPLSQVSNKKYSRAGGRKMSGGAFSKLLTRLSSKGYDLSGPLDLKEHWAKHGTNRYTTVK